jgi:serine/threonine protein kinase
MGSDNGALPRSTSNDALPQSESEELIEEGVPSSDKFPTGLFSSSEMKKFRFEKVLGSGSFGQICRAVHVPSGKACVVKKIKLKSSQNRAIARQEAQIGMAIDHPNVCKTYAYSEDADMVYIIMEYIEGMDLFQLIIDNPGIFQKNTSLFWSIVNTILHGLAAIHSSGIVHCDLKPENVLIGLSESEDKKTITCVKIADFGLSRQLGKIQGCDGGTHDYMAPEVAKGTLKDARLDIWSFGILIYAMFMTGIPSQIKGKNANDTLRKAEVIQNLCHLTQDDFKPFTHISPQEKFARIQQFILSCLRVNRIERPSLRELLAKISEFFPPVAVEKKDA